jgi:cellobiose epimerase
LGEIRKGVKIKIINFRGSMKFNNNRKHIMPLQKLEALKSEVKDELVINILPFWMTKMIDAENGGFYGRIDGSGNVYKDADKGCVLNARILWTFSSAYRIIKNPDYLKTAHRAKEYLFKYFIDNEYGGVFWLLDYKGGIKDGKKQIYALAFAIYGLTEYYRITNDKKCLDKAIDLFRLIEKYSFDQRLNGYFEAFSREWGIIGDLRLSAKDANEKKTMNTHLHVLEAYTNLFRIWKDDLLKKQLHGLIEVFTDKIVNNQTFNLNMFFDEEWNDKTDLVSYGHNIESSWLIYEAAIVLGEPSLISKVKNICLEIAESSKEGIMPDGGMIYEKFFTTGHVDYDRHWWVQAETVVGFLNAYALSEKEEYLNISLKSWRFISDNIIDRKNGEWYWSVDNDLKANLKDDKAGFWKCPYHDSRMCFEIIERNNQ